VPAAKTALRILGRRMLALDEEKARIDALITGLVTKTAPRLLEMDGGGHRHRGRVHQSGNRRSRRAFPMPAAEPVLLALAAGILTQVAWVGLRAACTACAPAQSRSPRPLQSPPWPPSSPRWLSTRPAEHAREHAAAYRAYAPTRARTGKPIGYLALVTGLAGSSSGCPRSSRACSA
jgi:hypothetical protein